MPAAALSATGRKNQRGGTLAEVFLRQDPRVTAPCRTVSGTIEATSGEAPRTRSLDCGRSTPRSGIKAR